MRTSQYLIEVLNSPSGHKVKVSTSLVEVLHAKTTPSPTTPTGAGVSLSVVEVLHPLMSSTSGVVRISAYVIEVLQRLDPVFQGGEELPATTVAFAYAG